MACAGDGGQTVDLPEPVRTVGEMPIATSAATSGLHLPLLRAAMYAGAAYGGAVGVWTYLSSDPESSVALPDGYALPGQRWWSVLGVLSVVVAAAAVAGVRHRLRDPHERNALVVDVVFAVVPASALTSAAWLAVAVWPGTDFDAVLVWDGPAEDRRGSGAAVVAAGLCGALGAWAGLLARG